MSTTRDRNSYGNFFVKETTWEKVGGCQAGQGSDRASSFVQQNAEIPQEHVMVCRGVAYQPQTFSHKIRASKHRRHLNRRGHTYH